jgi:hypothetical protein
MRSEKEGEREREIERERTLSREAVNRFLKQSL